MGASGQLTFVPSAGTLLEKRPQCEAPFARAASYGVLCYMAFQILPTPQSALGAALVAATPWGFFLAVANNLTRGLVQRQLRYTLRSNVLSIHLGL